MTQKPFCGMDKKVKQRVWRCDFTPNVLGVKKVYISASCFSDVMVKLHDDMKPRFVAENLVGVNLIFTEYE